MKLTGLESLMVRCYRLGLLSVLDDLEKTDMKVLSFVCDVFRFEFFFPRETKSAIGCLGTPRRTCVALVIYLGMVRAAQNMEKHGKLKNEPPEYSNYKMLITYKLPPNSAFSKFWWFPYLYINARNQIVAFVGVLLALCSKEIQDNLCEEQWFFGRP